MVSSGAQRLFGLASMASVILRGIDDAAAIGEGGGSMSS